MQQKLTPHQGLSLRQMAPRLLQKTLKDWLPMSRLHKSQNIYWFPMSLKVTKYILFPMSLKVTKYIWLPMYPLKTKYIWLPMSLKVTKYIWLPMSLKVMKYMWLPMFGK